MSADVGESLDDFFAKKDKKKKTKKTKSAFTPDDFHPVNEKPKKKTKSIPAKAGGETTDVAQEAKETPPTTAAATVAAAEAAAASTNEDTKKIEETDLSLAVESQGGRSEEDEWNDFAAEQEADYSGLRIQKLNIQEEAADEDEEVVYDDEGKVISAEIQVWKIPEIPASLTPEPTTEVQSTVGLQKTTAASNNNNNPATDDGSSSAAPQKYIPPAQRMAMKAAAAGGGRGESTSVPRTLGGPRRNPRTAPDISNEELFPTLGGKAGGAGGGVKGGPVLGGGLGSNASSRGQSPLTGGGVGGGKLITDVSLENKWDALSRSAE